MRIAFCGPAGCGKTSAAQYLSRKYGGAIVSFASKLKHDAWDYGWDGKKDERGRRFLQQLGQTVRAYDPNYWVDYALKNAPEDENLFVDDCRFPNELDTLRLAGFYIVYLVPQGLRMDEEWRNDPSENSLTPAQADVSIRSTQGRLDSLHKSLDALVGVLKGDEPPKKKGWNYKWGGKPDGNN